MEGDPTDFVYFDNVTLTQVENDLWMVETEYGLELDLASGADCASGSECFGDPLRGGFRVDLTDTGFVIAEGSFIQLDGWSSSIRVESSNHLGDTLEVTTDRTIATGTDLQVAVPAGTSVVEVVCGGWCGSCAAELFVRRES